MNINIRVKFANKAPDLQEILIALKESTGLPNIINKNRTVSHYIFKNKDFWIFSDGDVVNIDTCYADSWYLIEAAIGVLIKMGGQLENYDIPARAFKKWEPTDEFEDTIIYENSYRIVTFLGAIPSAETILATYKTHTGLFDIRMEPYIEPQMGLLDFVNEFIPPSSISINFQELTPPERSHATVAIFPENKVKSWYFLEALFATLVGLGGETLENIPKKAWVTWEKAEKLYENDPRFLKI